MDFATLSLSADLLAVTAELGYKALTPIQAASIPELLAGKDLIGQSKTGSGKTAAFALPILQNIDMTSRRVQALVLCPTRELCAQVAREIRKLGRRHKGLQVLPVSGGEPFRPQANSLQRGVHIVVGTPGRLLDHIARRTIDLRRTGTVVLDEADRMLDMGFQRDIEKVLEPLPRKRQTILFSATFPESILGMSRNYQTDAVHIVIDEPEEAQPDIRQLAITSEATSKFRALRWALGHFPHDSALIFCNLKATVAKLEHELAYSGSSVDRLHGDLEQFHRDQVLARFRNQSIRILVATDVAARGIDVSNLDLVVNYELPSQPEIYVHRIGRTGRAGKLGVAISLITPRDSQRVQAIEKELESPFEHITAGAEAPKTPPEAKMATIQISGGRKDKVRPGDILGALTGEAGGLHAKDVGKIEQHDCHSFVAVTKNLSLEAARAIDEGRLKGRRFRASIVERYDT